MKLKGKVISVIFAGIMLVPLGFMVYINRLPEKEPPGSLILDDVIGTMEAPFFLEDGRVFLKTQVLESLGIPFTVEAEEGRMVLHVSEGNVAYEDKVLTKQITEAAGNLNFPLKALNDGWFVELERLDHWLGLNSALTADKKSLILDSPGPRILGIVKPGGSKFYADPTGKGRRQRDLAEGETLRLFSENDSEYRIRTADGLIGYAPKGAITSYAEYAENQKAFTAVRTAPKQYGAINITYEFVEKYSENPDLSMASKIQGLDVLCPTWFSINEDGVVANDASIRYVREAHTLGYRVWGVFRNGFEPERTHALLENEGLKARAIADIAIYASFYELDGISIDFENVYKRDQAGLSDFLKELDAALTRQGVTFSVAAAPPWGSDEWSLFLDREAVSRIADYIILMAYDEHHANSSESGSVASLGWTEKAVSESLGKIPPEKLVLGVPLYTRIWTETPDGNGGVTVSSKAIGMKDQESVLLGKDPEYVFDEKAGQMTANFRENGAMKRIWMEDEASIKARMQIIRKYKLAGLASWRRGFETEIFWQWAREGLKGQ